MRLDPHTLTLLLCLQLFVLAVLLTAMAGRRGGIALRWGCLSLWAQFGAWVLAVLAPEAGAFSPLWGHTFGALGFACMLMAVQSWLGPRPLAPWVWSLPALLAGVLLLAPGNPFWRQGVGNLLLGCAVLLVVLGVLWPPQRPVAQGRWRWVLAFPLAVLGGLVLWRAWAGFFALAHEAPASLAVLLLSNLTALAAAVAFLAAWRAEAEAARLGAAPCDALTGLANRRELERRSKDLIHQARRHGDGLVAVVIEPDPQPASAGQTTAPDAAAMRLLAGAMQQVARPGDCAARLRDDALVLLLARTQATGAQALDARLRAAVHQQALPRLGYALSHSAGWSVLRAGDRHLQDLLQRADAALYRAKADGRGCLRGDADPSGADDAAFIESC